MCVVCVCNFWCWMLVYGCVITVSARVKMAKEKRVRMPSSTSTSTFAEFSFSFSSSSTASSVSVTSSGEIFWMIQPKFILPVGTFPYWPFTRFGLPLMYPRLNFKLHWQSLKRREDIAVESLNKRKRERKEWKKERKKREETVTASVINKQWKTFFHLAFALLRF